MPDRRNQAYGEATIAGAVPVPASQSSRHMGVGLIAGAAVGALVACASLSGLGVIFASWASSVALVLTSPLAKAAAPHRVGLCHIVSALIGLGVHALLPGFPWVIGLSVGVAVAIVLIGDIMHPPAIANAAFAFMSLASPIRFAGAAVLGAIFLAGFAFAHGVLQQRGRF